MKVVKVIYTLVFLLVMSSAMAQKKEISIARNWVKSVNNLEKAEQSMLSLLIDSANRKNEMVWNILFD